MANIAIFRINYKSDFILTLDSDAGWMTPFCIKFWTGAPSQAYFAGFDGETYTHCAPVDGEPTKIVVQFDDHHLPVGELKFQIGYHFTVADFPTSVEDEVLNQAAVIIDNEGTPEQVMLDFTGETAPEIEFSLPAYANEAQRIANEEQRIENEQERIAAEQQRIAQETARVNEFATLKSQSQAATSAANAAASLANEKAQLAADKAALADAAANLATQKAQLAADKAALAQQKADYAQAQGDYAKAQGDTALADHERAVEDHTQAGQDHTTAANDHITAGNDHTRAEADHTRAESDHAAVEVYVDSLGAFDISAYHATGGVLAKYADLTAALGTNGANIPEVLRKGGMSVKFVQSSDNKYVQYRLQANTFSTNISNWVNVEDEIFRNLSIYKTYPSAPNFVALSVIDLSISNRQDNYFYWLQLNYLRDTGFQQIVFFRTDAEHIDSYTSFVNLFYDDTSGNIQSGVKEYTGSFSSGEFVKIKVNWDLIYGLNFFNANLYEFNDWVYSYGRESQYFKGDLHLSDMPFDVEGVIKKVQNVGDTRLNLISANDFHQPPSSFWKSGNINYIKSINEGNSISFSSVGVLATWQGYLTAFIKLSDLERRTGLDFKNTDRYLDISLKADSYSRALWIVLRYGEDDKYNFETAGSLDAVLNQNGSTQGLSDGDTTTWAEKVISSTRTSWSVSNYKIPYNYANKKLYAILLCIGGNADGEKNYSDVTCVIHGSENVSIPFYYAPEEAAIRKNEEDIIALNELISELDVNPQDIFYAACGDSITNANHSSIEDIPESDPYMPIDGTTSVDTYKRKNYAYYIAKQYKIKWANYGWGGTTISNCVSKAYPESQLNPFVNDRITQLKSGVNWSYISIMFGWNDNAFGPTSQKDKWLYETYGQEIGYPVTVAQIGAEGFATQAQKDACDAATGTVDGVYYDNAEAYFFARFLGNINSNDKATWYGAWNYAVDYLMKKYPSAKIMVIAPFINSHKAALKDAVHNVAEKYGVVCFDFESLPYWYYAINENTTQFLNPDDINGYWYTGNGNRCAANVGGYNQARLSWDTLHPSNLGYRTMAGPIGDKLING